MFRYTLLRWLGTHSLFISWTHDVGGGSEYIETETEITEGIRVYCKWRISLNYCHPSVGYFYPHSGLKRPNLELTLLIIYGQKRGSDES